MGSTGWTLTFTTVLVSLSGIAVLIVIAALFVFRIPSMQIKFWKEAKTRFKGLVRKNSFSQEDINNRSKEEHYHQRQPQHKIRPSRPSSLPCLPEEKLYHSNLNEHHRGTLPNSRPSTFFRPTSPSLVPESSPKHRDHSTIKQKLSLALQSDGSDASNSSSSASAATELDDRNRLRSSSAEGVVRRQRRECHHGKSDFVMLRSSIQDDDIDELSDQWSPRPHCSESYDEGTVDGTSSTFEDSEISLTAGSTDPPSHRSAVIDLSLAYSPAASKLAVRISEITRVPGGSSSLQLRLLLLPDRKQRHRSKVRCVTSTNVVQVLETFIFSKVDSDELNVMGLRFRLYSCEKLRRQRLLAEAFFSLAKLNFEIQREHHIQLGLEPRSSTKSLGALGRSATLSGYKREGNSPAVLGLVALEQFLLPPRGDIPELLVGLAFNGTTGRLTTQIMKASNLSCISSSRCPDTCIKVLLLSCSGQELGRAKTTLRRNQSSPTFLETFMFQVTLFQIAEVTLLLTVINKRSLKRRELLGWVSMGFDNSSEETANHWQEMREANGEQVV